MTGGAENLGQPGNGAVSQPAMNVGCRSGGRRPAPAL